MPSVNTLYGFSVLGFIACIGMYNLYVSTRRKQIKDSALYTQAMEMIRTNSNVKELLGEPIIDKKINIYSRELAQMDHPGFTVNLKGSKSDGILFITVVPDDELKKEKLSAVELQIGKDDSKRLVINEVIK